jgi:hypothetical protein
MQSGGMFRPTQNLIASNYPSFKKGALISQTFSGRRRRNRASRGGAGMSLPPLISSYVDPWDEESVGIRYPDSYRGLSGTYTGTLVGPISTNSATGGATDLNMVSVVPTPGTSLLFFTPDPSNALVLGICGTGAGGFLGGFPKAFHWPNGINFTNAPGSLNAFGPGSGSLNVDGTIGNLTGLRQLYSSGRLVAGGVKFTSTMNFSTVSGTIHMAPYAYNLNNVTTTFGPTIGGATNPTLTEMANGWQPALPANLAAMANLPGYVQYPLSSLEQDEMVSVFKRFGEEALLFKPLTNAWGMDDRVNQSLAVRQGDANIPSTLGHYGILMFIDGVVTSAGGAVPVDTPLLEYEYRTHYECQPTAAVSLATVGLTSTLYASGATSLCSPSPYFQPLLMAAADNLVAEVPAVRCVDDAGVEEGGFLDEVTRLWSSATSIASSVSTAIPSIAGLMSALAI